MERLAEAVTLVKRLFTEDEVTFEGSYYRTDKAVCLPKTVQRPHPPILIAGGGPRMLELAAREADIFALVHYPAASPPTVADVSVDGARAQLDEVRRVAGERFSRLELSMFVDCIVTDDRERSIAELATTTKRDPAVLRASIYRATGSLDAIATHLRMLNRELGMTYFCLRGPDIERLGPVMSELSRSGS